MGGHYLGKRSADAEAEPHLGYYGYPYAYGYYPYALHLPKVAPIAKDGVAVHPGAATSFVSRSPQGARGKRSAEPWGYGYPWILRIPIPLRSRFCWTRWRRYLLRRQKPTRSWQVNYPKEVRHSILKSIKCKLLSCFCCLIECYISCVKFAQTIQPLFC